MALIADILLIAGALGAAFYCIVLSRRLNQFRSLETGVGGAIAGLSEQVADMTRALDRAKSEAKLSSTSLDESAKRAEEAARRLELLLASLHDLPAEKAARPAPERPTSGAPTFRRRVGRHSMMEPGE